MPEPKAFVNDEMLADVLDAEKMFKADVYLSTFPVNDHLLLKMKLRL